MSTDTPPTDTPPTETPPTDTRPTDTRPTPEIHRIPLDQIDAERLPRDRSGLDEEALTELRSSIAATGLRMPVELCPLDPPEPPFRYALISGYRRLAAIRTLAEFTGQPRYATIPAFLRTPASLAQAMTAMVEENEIRADLSPYERGRIAWAAHTREIFPSIDQAITALYPSANRMKRTRLRALAHLASELDGHLTAPETLTQAQCLRLSAACQQGFGDLIRTALEESTAKGPDDQWALVKSILTEAEHVPTQKPDPRPGYPRRITKPRHGLTIRRELREDGWTLHFTGREATSGLLDRVFEEIERLFAPVG